MRPARSKKTVLVVDDEPSVRSYVRSVLLRQGYEVLEASDGQAAYELLQSAPGGVELVITDVQMPRMDGITLGRKVGEEFPGTGVLYISGFILEPPSDIPQRRFLPKPFTPDRLVQWLRKTGAA